MIDETLEKSKAVRGGNSAQPEAREPEQLNPDISRADFTFALLALDWGWSVEETAARLMLESRKAQENGEAYADRTVRNAAAALERRRSRQR